MEDRAPDAQARGGADDRVEQLPHRAQPVGRGQQRPLRRPGDHQGDGQDEERRPVRRTDLQGAGAGRRGQPDARGAARAAADDGEVLRGLPDHHAVQQPVPGPRARPVSVPLRPCARPVPGRSSEGAAACGGRGATPSAGQAGGARGICVPAQPAQGTAGIGGLQGPSVPLHGGPRGAAGGLGALRRRDRGADHRGADPQAPLRGSEQDLRASHQLHPGVLGAQDARTGPVPAAGRPAQGQGGRGRGHVRAPPVRGQQGHFPHRGVCGARHDGPQEVPGRDGGHVAKPERHISPLQRRRSGHSARAGPEAGAPPHARSRLELHEVRAVVRPQREPRPEVGLERLVLLDLRGDPRVHLLLEGHERSVQLALLGLPEELLLPLARGGALGLGEHLLVDALDVEPARRHLGGGGDDVRLVHAPQGHAVHLIRPRHEQQPRRQLPQAHHAAALEAARKDDQDRPRLDARPQPRDLVLLGSPRLQGLRHIVRRVHLRLPSLGRRRPGVQRVPCPRGRGADLAGHRSSSTFALWGRQRRKGEVGPADEKSKKEGGGSLAGQLDGALAMTQVAACQTRRWSPRREGRAASHCICRLRRGRAHLLPAPRPLQFVFAGHPSVRRWFGSTSCYLLLGEHTPGHTSTRNTKPPRRAPFGDRAMGTEGGEPRPRGLRPTEEDMAKHYAHLEHLRRKDKTLVGWTRRKVHQLSTVVCIAELTRGEVIGVLTVFFLIFGGLCRVCAVYIPQLLSYISRRAGLLHK